MKKYFFAFILLIFPGIVFAQIVGGISVQTNPATNIFSNQATLNGYFSFPYISGSNSLGWFQWGTDTNYPNSSSPQTISGNSGSFSQNIANLSPNTTYHFRAVFQSGGNTVYGQDVTFATLSDGNVFSVAKKVINLTSGNLSWQSSVNANPLDVLSFAITIQAGSQDLHNVTITDHLPSNLIYRDNLLVNANLNYSGNPASGINLGTIRANEVAVVSYQAQVSPSSNFAYGLTTITTTAGVYSSERGTQNPFAQVFVNKTTVSGATDFPTGATNNLFADNFLLPLFLVVLMSWLYFTGRVYRFADWLGARIK